jgi:hypothetical protein
MKIQVNWAFRDVGGVSTVRTKSWNREENAAGFISSIFALFG